MPRANQQGRAGSGRPENPYNNQPRLEPEDLGGKSQAIFTIAKADWVNMAPADEAEEGKTDHKLVLEYEEVPGKQHVLNKTSYRTLEAKLPTVKEHEREWIGQRVPLVVANPTDPQTGETVKKVWVASKKKYDAIMAKDTRASAKKRR